MTNVAAEPWNWRREDLDRLIDQAESIRLDFKQSKLFEKPRDRYIEDLSREVSAFANTEGGLIVIGVAEKRVGKARVAEYVDDGVDIHVIGPESLQQLIESNVSPYLSGVRVKGIRLTEVDTRMAYVVFVPQGSTAYQAIDRRYYGRSEYESKPLPDHEVRLRMFRGKLPSGGVALTHCSGQRDKRPIHIEPGSTFDSDIDCQIDLAVVNTGEVNITEFKVHLSFNANDVTGLIPFEESVKEGWMVSAISYARPAAPDKPMRVNIYPQDRHALRHVWFPLHKGVSLETLGLTINWTLHLPNSQPIRGSINVADEWPIGL